MSNDINQLNIKDALYFFTNIKLRKDENIIAERILEEIIRIENPDAILPTMGGQTGLNAAMLLHKKGILKNYNIELIGANAESIDKAEDRQKFKKHMNEIGLESARSAICTSFDQAKKILEEIKFILGEPMKPPTKRLLGSLYIFIGVPF